MTPDLVTRIEAQLAVERAWAYHLRVHEGMHYAAIRALAPRPAEQGGIGRFIGIADVKGMIAQHRAEQGDVFGSREERMERRQIELDTLALGARAALARAAEVDALDKDAAKVLLDVRAAEAKMHGDDAAQRHEVEVTQRDAVADELAAMLEDIDRTHEGAR